MKKWERIGGYCILAYAAGLIYQSLDLSLGSAGEPGSGFLGLFLGIGMAVSSLAVVFKNRGPELQSGGAVQKAFWRKGAWVKPLFALAILGCFVAAMAMIGTILSLAGFFLVWMKFLEKKGWGTAVLVSLFGTTGFYVLFGVLLRIQFPRGLFGL